MKTYILAPILPTARVYDADGALRIDTVVVVGFARVGNDDPAAVENKRKHFGLSSHPNWPADGTSVDIEEDNRARQRLNGTPQHHGDDAVFHINAGRQSAKLMGAERRGATVVFVGKMADVPLVE